MSDTLTREAADIRAIFDRLASRKLGPGVYGLMGTFQFDVDGVGRWYVTISNGGLTISQGHARADCAIGCSATDFIRITEGKLNLVAAFLQGRVRGAGDVAMALGFSRLLPLKS